MQHVSVIQIGQSYWDLVADTIPRNQAWNEGSLVGGRRDLLPSQDTFAIPLVAKALLDMIASHVIPWRRKSIRVLVFIQ
jgi:hypothetical protein